MTELGLIHYEGSLGTFDYNPDDWFLDDTDVLPEYHSLRYRGVETDGRKIIIPSGLKSIYESFKGCIYLMFPPLLEEGIVNGNRAFVGCYFLRRCPVLPHSMKYISEMLKGCRSLENAMVIHEGVEICHHLYDGCPVEIKEAGLWNIEHRGLDFYDYTA